MKKIGIFNATRFWQKYVFGNPPEGYFYKRAIDIPMHLFKIQNQFLCNTKWVLPFQNYDLFHTYNSIIPVNAPWVVEVESFLPRYGNSQKEGDLLYKWGVKRLQHKSCKAIIFTSKFSQEMNRPNFEKWGIMNKGQVIYRAVQAYSSLISENESEFHILFAGNAFYRKGGIELLKALERINNPHIKVTIISNFEVDWEIYPTEAEIAWVHSQISKDKRITLHTSLPHHKVVDIMRTAHVFVATTFADPFNNTILESMACGVPIIATDIRSIPEFVEEGMNGFTITPNKENKEPIVDFIEEKLNFLLNNQTQRQQMAQHSSNIIKDKFSLEARNEKLKVLYDGIL
ncbi:MAG: glycosyltransferase [Bacteroidota bacterium]|nr:glycosyltransferase [Bacteroidota bacterium]